jgi:hypothetical protein
MEPAGSGNLASQEPRRIQTQPRYVSIGRCRAKDRKLFRGFGMHPGVLTSIRNGYNAAKDCMSVKECGRRNPRKPY